MLAATRGSVRFRASQRASPTPVNSHPYRNPAQQQWRAHISPGLPALSAALFRPVFIAPPASQPQPKIPNDPHKEERLDQLKSAADAKPHALPMTGILEFINNCKFYEYTLGLDLYKHVMKIVEQGSEDQKNLMLAMIHLSTRSQRKERAELVLFEMKRKGMLPTKEAYEEVLNLCASQKDIGAVEAILRHMRSELGEKKPTEEQFVTWILAFGQVGYMARAEDLLDEMHLNDIPPTVAVYEAMFQGYHHVNTAEKATTILKHMKADNVKPTKLIFRLMMHICCNLKNYHLALRLFREMRTHGLEHDVETWNILIDTFVRSEQLKTAKNFLADMDTDKVKPDADTYGILIQAYMKARDMNTVEGLVAEMLYIGVQPTKQALEAIGEGYCREGELDKAFKIVDILRSREEQPGSKYRHILHSHARKKGSLETFNKYFPLKNVQPQQGEEDVGESSFENEPTEDEPTAMALADLGFQPARNQFYKGKANRMPLVKQLMREQEVDGSFRPKDWITVEDPLSNPRQDTLDRRAKNQRANARLKLSADESLREAEEFEQRTDAHRKEKRKLKAEARLRSRTIKPGSRVPSDINSYANQDAPMRKRPKLKPKRFDAVPGEEDEGPQRPPRDSPKARSYRR